MSELSTDNVEVAKLAAATRITEALLAKYSAGPVGIDKAAAVAAQTFTTVYAAVEKAYQAS